MSRIRTIKPGFFTHSDLFDAEQESGLPLRVAYAGLWTVADRDGKFKWKPREIKLAVLPYDNLDMTRVLDALCKFNFVLRYKCAGEEYGLIPKFAQHQHVNPREAPSTLPDPPKEHASSEREERTPDASPRVDDAQATRLREEGKEFREGEVLGREGEGVVEVAPQADAPQPQPKSVRGTRWPKGTPVPDPWLEDAATKRQEHQLEPVDLRLEAEKFVNHWVSKAGGRGVGLDWHAAWMNWALRAEKPRTNGFHRKESEHEKLERVTREFIQESSGNTGGNRGAYQPLEPELLAPDDERKPIKGVARNLLPGPRGTH